MILCTFKDLLLELPVPFTCLFGRSLKGMSPSGRASEGIGPSGRASEGVSPSGSPLAG